MKSINPIFTESWKSIMFHYNLMKNKKILDFFNNDNKRFSNFSLKFKDIILFDYSKNIFNNKTINLFIDLFKEIKLKYYIDLMLSGGNLNFTEKKCVTNFLLRSNDFSYLKNKFLLNVKKNIKIQLGRIKKLTSKILSRKWFGYNGDVIENIVNIGIGGSDIGPKMIVKSLIFYKKSKINFYFVSNLDSFDVMSTLKKVHPSNTLFLICSKSFTTLETLSNASISKKWILDYFNNDLNSLNNHFILVTSNYKESLKFGMLNKENIFLVPDWVCGRFSYNTAFGLSISLFIGYSNFIKLLEGCSDMDSHFFNESYEKNIPFILSILDVWYNNFFGFNNKLIVVYNELLSFLPEYLQQVMMESNGKYIDRSGKYIKKYKTSPIILGGVGTNIQHSFFQLLHQGTFIVPCDFIAVLNNGNDINNSNLKLLSNVLAQSRSLAFGDSLSGYISSNNYDKFLGNRPNNIILLNKITPYSLGVLLTAYDYKVFLEGVLWNICSYDQWGVELAKKSYKDIYEILVNSNLFNKKILLDNSTENLIKYVKSNIKF